MFSYQCNNISKGPLIWLCLSSKHMRTCQYLVHETDHSSLKDSFRHRSGRDPFKKILGGVCFVFKLDVIPKNLETDRE